MLRCIYAMATIIVDETDEKARRKLEEYQNHASYDGALALLSGWTGIVFGQYAPSDTVKKIDTNASLSTIEQVTGGEKPWTIEDLARWGGIGGLGPLFVGSASTVADLLQEWVEETDIDGFNLAYTVAHETFADVIGYVVPELQSAASIRLPIGGS